MSRAVFRSRLRGRLAHPVTRQWLGGLANRPGSQPQLSQNLFVGDALAPLNRVARAPQSSHSLGGEFLVINRHVGKPGAPSRTPS